MLASLVRLSTDDTGGFEACLSALVDRRRLRHNGARQAQLSHLDGDIWIDCDNFTPTPVESMSACGRVMISRLHWTDGDCGGEGPLDEDASRAQSISASRRRGKHSANIQLRKRARVSLLAMLANRLRESTCLQGLRLPFYPSSRGGHAWLFNVECRTAKLAAPCNSSCVFLAVMSALTQGFSRSCAVLEQQMIK